MCNKEARQVKMSDTDSSGGTESDIADILQQEPMYYVLSQFLETPKNENIATILDKLVDEVRQLRLTIQNAKNAATAAPAPAAEQLASA